MWSYLWDCVDDGIDATLRDMKENLGLTALSVATHYHSVEHLRPHTRGAFIYRADSSLYFAPDEKYWHESPMRHQVAPVAGNDALRQVCQRAAEVGLDVVSWTLCCHGSWLGRTYPESTEQNAFGDHHPESLCPANPAVRAFLKALVGDLSHNYDLSLLELESCHFAGSRHFHHHEKIGVTLSPLDQFLLATCFCAHCRERGHAAGVDADAVQARFQEAIRQTFDSGQPHQESLREWIDATPEVEGYLQARVATVNTLLTEMRDASTLPLSPIVWSSPEAAGTDGKTIADITGNITVTAYHTDVEDTRQTIAAAVAMAGDVSKIRVGYHTYPPVMPDLSTCLRNIEASLDLGVQAFSFYHYGIAPRPNLDWVRAAAELIHRRLG
jgi:hypothetical protein